MSEGFLLVDFENVRELDLAGLPDGWHVRIFIGRSQNTIPFAIANDAQRLGKRLEWIKIEGDGHNNLDFHLAFYLGELARQHPQANFAILTKDKGFDPLVKHLGQRSIQCRRVATFNEVAPPQIGEVDAQFARVFQVLSGIEKKSRPRRRKSLVQHVASTFKKTLPEADVEKIVKQLLSKRLVSETNNSLTYHF